MLLISVNYTNIILSNFELVQFSHNTIIFSLRMEKHLNFFSSAGLIPIGPFWHVVLFPPVERR